MQKEFQLQLKLQIIGFLTIFTETTMHLVYPPPPAPPPPHPPKWRNHCLWFLLGRLYYPGDVYVIFIFLCGVGRGGAGVNTSFIMVSVKVVNAKFGGQTECIMGRCESGEFLSACFVLLFLKFENTLKVCNLPCPKLICVICVIRSRSIFRSRYDVRAY